MKAEITEKTTYISVEDRLSKPPILEVDIIQERM